MNILIFDIQGKFAHFRKFYTNSSSLTYSVPPRTTTTGILAAIMGLARNSYYDIFSKDKMKIAVKKLNPTRKLMQTVNYIKATGWKELISLKAHTQIPFEILTGDEGVRYRIYLNHIDPAVMDELEARLKNSTFVFPPYLGAAPFNATISYLGRYNINEENSDDYVEIATIINQNFLKEVDLNFSDNGLALVKEKLPIDFAGDRNIKEVGSYLFEENGKKLKVKLLQPYFSVNYCGNVENIIFL